MLLPDLLWMGSVALAVIGGLLSVVAFALKGGLARQRNAVYLLSYGLMSTSILLLVAASLVK